jgi:uncharacterized protein (DUF58 family)
MSRPRSARVSAWPRLTRRGGSLVIVGVLLLAVSLWFDLRDILLLAFVGIAMPVVAAIFVVVRTPRLAVTRGFAPPVVPAGGWTRVSLVVKNRGRRTFDGAHWRDTVPEGFMGPPEAILPAIGPYEGVLPSGDDTVRLEYRLRMPRRGVYSAGPLRIGVTDPFGLARIDREIGTGHEIVVTPRVTPLDAALGSAASIDGVVHGLQRRTHPNSDELIAREYRYGDPLRRVNWAATARRGELMVREEEQRGDPEARILLDTTLAGRPHVSALRRENDEGTDFGFELGVEVAASIAVHLLERGFRVRCTQVADPERGVFPGAAFGGGYRMPGGDRLILEDLARLDGPGRPTGHQADTAAADARPRAREARAPGFAVLVDPDEQDARNLIALRPTFEPAVAFATDGVSRPVLQLLEAADWRIIRVRRPVEIGDAWSGIAMTARALAATSITDRAESPGRGAGEVESDAP